MGPAASLLIVNIAHRWVDDTQIEYSEFADYDLGQAVGAPHASGPGPRMGVPPSSVPYLQGLSGDLDVAPGWQIRSMTAVGRATGQVPPRERRPLAGLRPPQISRSA